MDKLIVIVPVTVFFLIMLWYVEAYRLFRPEGIPAVLPVLPDGTELITNTPRYSLTRLDKKIILILTLVYGIVAFTLLGDMDAPQSVREYSANEVSVFDFGTAQDVEKIMYFTSLHTGEYTIEVSDDGESWEKLGTMTQKFNKLFKWLSPEEVEGFKARYIRISADARMDLAELAFVAYDGSTIIPDHDSADNALFDEQHIVPERQTYMNSSYFDEIYHPRTALEHIKEVTPYEISHPPLGKIIMSLGIRMFGMTPFGWRFMGTAFGVAMVPILYVLLKLMFGCTPAVAAGTFLFTFDFMHFVQTRIATIDTYAVFFIMVSFLFMFLFTRQHPDETSLKSRLIPLGLSGTFWGIGCASKWTVIYAGAGLGLIWLLYWICRGVYLKKQDRLKALTKELCGNIIFCIFFFVIVPLSIYYMSYYPYGAAAGMHGIGTFFKKEYFDIVWENQQFMWGYHSDLVAEHPYASRWYHWLIDARPILYFLDYIDGSTKSAFGAFSNPMLCWTGLFAMLCMFWRAIRLRDWRAGMISIGYLSSLLPWVLVTRLTFAYHYFPCILFIAMAVCYVFTIICQKVKNWRPWLLSICVPAGALFIMFYPVLTGIPFSKWYTSTFLRWFPGAWPF